jgi:hypothetical protein
MRREAAIVFARQAVKKPILRPRTGSGHLMLLVAVASLERRHEWSGEAPPISKR